MQNNYSLVNKLMKLVEWMLHYLSEKAVLGRLLVTWHFNPCVATDEILLIQRIQIFPEPHLKQCGGRTRIISKCD